MGILVWASGLHHSNYVFDSYFAFGAINTSFFLLFCRWIRSDSLSFHEQKKSANRSINIHTATTTLQHSFSFQLFSQTHFVIIIYNIIYRNRQSIEQFIRLKNLLFPFLWFFVFRFFGESRACSSL